jgi:hypothetical protein
MVQRAPGSTADITNARCYLVVELRNRSGESQPYDAQ